MPPPADKTRFDVVLVGGGLQNALIAMALLEVRGDTRVALVEREQIGGRHTWCFHAEDLPEAAGAFVEPLIEWRWDGYDVAFPGLRRSLQSRYCGFSSEHLRAVVERRFADAPGSELFCGVAATVVEAQRVELADGRVLEGALVVDARGPQSDGAPAGYQKFVGREFEFAEPHGMQRPVVMDATVPQLDGFRFFYLLPLGPTRLLVEDTRFSDSPELDRPAMRAEIDRYLAGLGFAGARMLSEEEGSLPMPLSGPCPEASASPLRAGYAGGFFHPATGYSFPVAVRVALHLATATELRADRPLLVELCGQLHRQVRYAQRLNRLLFQWFMPEQRRQVFERFYRLPETTIRRFYALAMTRRDRFRILIGRPPRGMSFRARLSVTQRLYESSNS